MAAVCTFMGAGFAMATLRYYTEILEGGPNFGDEYPKVWRWIALVLIILANIYSSYIIIKHSEKRKEFI